MRDQAPPLTRTLTMLFTPSHHPDGNVSDASVKRRTFTRRISSAISAPFGGRPLHDALDAQKERTATASPSSIQMAELDVNVTRPTPKTTMGDISGNELSSSTRNRWTESEILHSSPQNANLELPLTSTINRTVAYASTPDVVEDRQKFRREATLRSRTGATPVRHRTYIDLDHRIKSRDAGLGGLPGPINLLSKFAKSVTPTRVKRRVKRAFTAPPPTTLVPTSTMDEGFGVTRKVKYLTSAVVNVGRNSRFNLEELSDEQLEEVGGVEYRALRVLGYLVGAVSRHSICSNWSSTLLKHIWS